MLVWQDLSFKQTSSQRTHTAADVCMHQEYIKAHAGLQADLIAFGGRGGRSLNHVTYWLVATRERGERDR